MQPKNLTKLITWNTAVKYKLLQEKFKLLWFPKKSYKCQYFPGVEKFQKIVDSVPGKNKTKI